MIPTGFLVIPFGRRGHIGEDELSDFHLGTKDYRDIIEVAELENDVEIVSRVDESCRVVDNESDAGERTLPRELDEVLVRSEIVLGNPENRRSGMERKALVIS